MSSSAAPADTIAAIATTTAPAGVGIVRVSGPDAFRVADRLRAPGLASLGTVSGHTLRRARLYDPVSGEEIDDALLAVFHGPRSLTGENVVEIQGHGGSVTLGRVLSAVLSAGARAARPGEFTERAFLNGKMDLAQAEAVADLVSARTVAAQRIARRQASGALSRAVHACADDLKTALALIEASIDFPEEIGEIEPDAVEAPLASAQDGIAALLRTARYGQRLRDGVTVVLAGRPNVGKSSLLNALAGFERAIVTALPGTTRDVIGEDLQIGGLPARALDTAGIRETSDPVERIGVARARQAIADADVVIAVLDAGAGLTEEDRAFLVSLEGRSVVVAVNKADTADPSPILAAVSLPAVATSAITGAGLEELAAAVATAATGADSGALAESAVVVTSARHASALERAQSSVAAARVTLKRGLPAELIAVDAHGALAALGEITGETSREEIIAGIFSRFCLGK